MNNDDMARLAANVSQLPPELHRELLTWLPWEATKTDDDLWRIKFVRITKRHKKLDTSLSWHDNALLAIDLIKLTSEQLFVKYRSTHLTPWARQFRRDSRPDANVSDIPWMACAAMQDNASLDVIAPMVAAATTSMDVAKIAVCAIDNGRTDVRILCDGRDPPDWTALIIDAISVFDDSKVDDAATRLPDLLQMMKTLFGPFHIKDHVDLQAIATGMLARWQSEGVLRLLLETFQSLLIRNIALMLLIGNGSNDWETIDNIFRSMDPELDRNLVTKAMRNIVIFEHMALLKHILQLDVPIILNQMPAILDAIAKEAINRDNMTFLQIWLHHGGQVDNPIYMTLAVTDGKKNAIRFLLQNGASFNDVLENAIIRDDAKIVESCLEAGAILTDEHVSAALRHMRTNVLEVLMTNATSLTTMVNLAMKRDDVDMIATILRMSNIGILLLLKEAIFNEKPRIGNFLIEHGASIQELLSSTVENGEIDGAKRIVKFGGPSLNNSFLSFAILHNHEKTIRYLLRNGASLASLLLAVITEKQSPATKRVIKYCIESGGVKRATLEQAAMIAARRGDGFTVKLCIKHGAKNKDQIMREMHTHGQKNTMLLGRDLDTELSGDIVQLMRESMAGNETATEFLDKHEWRVGL